jgi:hypothetical protein
MTEIRALGMPVLTYARASIFDTAFSDIRIYIPIRFIFQPNRYRSRQTFRWRRVIPFFRILRMDRFLDSPQMQTAGGVFRDLSVSVGLRLWQYFPNFVIPMLPWHLLLPPYYREKSDAVFAISADQTSN